MTRSNGDSARNRRDRKTKYIFVTGGVVSSIGKGLTASSLAALLEAIRQLRLEGGPGNTLNIHVTLVPYIRAAGELKTKPTQHSVRELQNIGISPDMIVCRTEAAMPPEMKAKLSLFCNVPPDCVITAQDVSTIYELPEALHREGLDYRACELLGIWSPEPNLSKWREIVEVIKAPELPLVHIAVVGKYVDLADSYKSLHEALTHGGIANRVRVELDYVDSELFEQSPDIVATRLNGAHGILVPGGFGKRGVEGKIAAVRYAREHKVPYFGICLGLQVAIIEFARNVCGLKANSTEFEPDCEVPVISLLASQRSVSEMGGTMRLGASPARRRAGSLAAAAYGATEISERHRHRWEVSNAYRDVLAEHGMRLSGQSPDGGLIEIIELPDSPWHLGCQFHPELKSRPTRPHPLFASFIAAAKKHAFGDRETPMSVRQELLGTPR